MKKVLLILACAICMASAASRVMDGGEKTTPLEKFDEIDNSSSVDIIYSQGSKHEYIIVASPEDKDKIKVLVKNGKLSISVKSKKKTVGKTTIYSTYSYDDVVVKISSPELKSVSCIGSGGFSANTDITSDNIKFSISGSSDIDLKAVTASSIRLNIAGSGDISLKQASAEALKADIAGSGDIKIDKVDDRCKSANLRVAGSGDMDIAFGGCQNLDCSVFGSGSIRLSGQVYHYSGSVFGAGEILKTGLKINGNIKTSNGYSTSAGQSPMNMINAKP